MLDLLLTDVERKNMSGALIDIALAGQVFVAAVSGQQIVAGTASAAWTHDAVNKAGSWNELPPVELAHSAFWLAALSGADHAKALAASVRGPQRVNMALGTIARDGVEALSRAHWLLSASSANETVGRLASLASNDLNYVVKMDVDSKVYHADGSEELASGFRAKIVDFSTALPGGAIKFPGITKLATEFIDTAAEHGRMSYSRLSSAAHGELYTLANFTQPIELEGSPSGNYVGITLALAAEYSRYLFTALDTVVYLAAEHFCPATDVIERWKAASGRSLERLQLMDASRFSSVERADGSRFRVSRFDPRVRADMHAVSLDS